MSCRKVYFIFMLFVCLGVTFSAAAFPTFFTYTQDEINALKASFSDHMMSKDQLRKWDYIATRAVEDKKLNHFEFTRLFTYLYVAQSDAAVLSQELFGDLKGSLDPVSNCILTFFRLNYSMPELYEDDSYSQNLARIISAKVRERMEKENALQTTYTVPPYLQNHFSIGLETAKWIPWFTKPVANFWAVPPPATNDPIWKEQIQAIKKAQEPMTLEKKQEIYFWAGMCYPWCSDMRVIVNLYLLSCNNFPTIRVVTARAAVATGFYDCEIVCFSAKYRYMVARPQMCDPTIVYMIPVPKHPSYPAGHSVESATVATMMAALFPEDEMCWSRMANMCGLSRIWAGVHFPIDDTAGRESGRKVAKKVLESLGY